MAIQYVDEAEISGKRVLARFDFNVPLDKVTKKILDPSRIDQALPTIRAILEKGPKKLVMMSHLGRPKGEPDASLSLAPVAEYLATQLKEDVVLTESCLDRGIKTLLSLPGNRIILLENTRFHQEEKKNDWEFAKTLASYGDLYVNDAFGTCHRKHASTYLLNAFFKKKSYAGYLIKKEVEALDKIVQRPQRPFIAIVGGAKVEDKIKILEGLLPNVNYLIVGGAMAYPFLKAQGFSVGKSLCSQEDVQLAKKLLTGGRKEKIILPIDHYVSDSIEGLRELQDSPDISSEKMGLDIGPKSQELFKSKLLGAKTVLWNGPMGLFENPLYSEGTLSIAKTLSELKNAFTLVGGGDSVSAVRQSGLAEKMGHVSTGGGASLEYIEQGGLPGIQALKFGIDL